MSRNNQNHNFNKTYRFTSSGGQETDSEFSYIDSDSNSNSRFSSAADESAALITSNNRDQAPLIEVENGYDVMYANENSTGYNNIQQSPSLLSKTKVFLAFSCLTLIAFTAFGIAEGTKNGASEFGERLAKALPLLANACRDCTQGLYADLIFAATAIVSSALTGGSAALIQKCREPKTVSRNAIGDNSVQTGRSLQAM